MTNLRTFAALGALCVLGLSDPHANAQKTMGEPAKHANVFVHPEKLTATDKLSDGKSGDAIEIKGETTLIWVDRMPDARFAHPTEYVLISVDGTRVVKGNWRPVLNGNELFTQATKPYKVESPIHLPGK
jgi:hypothetical protein